MENTDTLILSLLKNFPYFSTVAASLSVRLSDYAAQLVGFRSTRQVNALSKDLVSERHSLLLNSLYFHVREVIRYIENPHVYKEGIENLSSDDLELLLENALYEMVVFDDRRIFAEQFFVS